MPWIPANVDQRLPRNAIIGGRDKDGHSIYIGRAWVNGELVPCNVIPGKKKAIAATLNSEVQEVENYEVLCGDVYVWKKAASGDVPGASLIAGRSNNGEQLYVGRILNEGGLYPGVIQTSRKTVRIPVDEHVVENGEYDVLTVRTADKNCGCGCIVT